MGSTTCLSPLSHHTPLSPPPPLTEPQQIKEAKRSKFPYNDAFLRHDILHWTFVPDAATWNMTCPGKYNHSATLHIWMRCTCHYKDPLAHLGLRGFIYAEPHTRDTHPLLPLRQPIHKWWQPTLEAVINSQTRVNFSVSPTPNNESPISVELDLVTGEHEVHIQMLNWNQYHSLSVADCCSKPPPDEEEHSSVFSPEVVVVLNKMFNIRALFAADLLTTHIHYHKCLGVKRYVLFASKAQAAKLHKVPAVAKLVEVSGVPVE